MRVALLLVLLLVAPVLAHGQVGTVAAVKGSAEVRRQGGWIALAENGMVAVGEEIRTGRPGGLRIVFAESSLVLGDDTEVTVSDYPSAGKPSGARFKLLRGKVLASASTWFAESRRSFEIITATAVMIMQGTEFAAVYDPVADVTEVVGVSNTTRVYSTIDSKRRRGVSLEEKDLTVVERGKFPLTPRKLDEVMFRQYLEGLEFIGSRQSQAPTHPLVGGAAVPSADQADAVMVAPIPSTQSPGAMLADEHFLPHPMAPFEGGLVQPGREAPVSSQPPASVQQRSRGGVGIDF